METISTVLAGYGPGARLQREEAQERATPIAVLSKK